LPQPCSRANGGGNVYGFVSTGLHLRKPWALGPWRLTVVIPWKWDGNGMEKWLVSMKKGLKIA